MIIPMTHKVALACLIAVSIGTKIIFDTPIYYDHLPGRLIESANQALATAGFQTILNAAIPSVVARKDDCILTVTTARAQGGDDAAPKIAKSGPQNVYWYRGTLYDTVPRYRILFDRALQRLGTITSAHPAILPLFRLSSLADCTRKDLASLPLPISLENEKILIQEDTP